MISESFLPDNDDDSIDGSFRQVTNESNVSVECG